MFYFYRYGIYSKKICNKKKEKSLPRHPICITDADHYYILDEIICQEKLIFERQIETDVESDYNHK